MTTEHTPTQTTASDLQVECGDILSVCEHPGLMLSASGGVAAHHRLDELDATAHSILDWLSGSLPDWWAWVVTPETENPGGWQEWPLPVTLGTIPVFLKKRRIGKGDSPKGYILLFEPCGDWGQQLFHAGGDDQLLLFETDLEGRIVRGAEAIAAATGISEKDLHSRRLEDLMVPDSRDRLRDSWGKILEGRVIRGREVYFHSDEAHPAPYWLWLSLKPGESSRIRGVALNISAHKSLAFALEAAEERFNVLYRESSDPVLLTSMEGDVLSVNSAFEAATGYSSASMFMGDSTWADFVHPDDINIVASELRRCIRQDQRVTVEYRMKNRGGEYPWFELGLTVLHNETGEGRGVVAVSRDIDQRKIIETRLRQQAESLEEKNQKAQALIGNLKHFFTKIHELPSEHAAYVEGVCELVYSIYKPKRVQIILMTEGAESIQTVEAGVHLDQRERDTGMFPLSTQVLNSQLPTYVNNVHHDVSVARHPTTLIHLIKTYLGVPLLDASGKVRGVLSIFDDRMRAFESLDVELLTIAGMHVGSRLRADEQDRARRNLEDHLKRASKMEAVGMLAGGIAHDFNNILSGILGFSSYLLSKAEPGSDLHRDLGTIEQSAIKASQLTRQLQAFTRHKHFEKSTINIHEILEDVLGIVSRSLSKNVSIKTSFSADPPLVSGDSGQLNQVFMNLCLNAFEAMARDGGVLTVQTERRSLSTSEKKSLTRHTAESYIVIDILDTGRGMDQDTLDHIFDPFYTTKGDRGGSGLGLSIAYGTITNHEGSISVSSRKGQGTRFTLHLPAARDAVNADEGEEEIDVTGKERILVLDDELILRQMVTEVLTSKGYRVEAFSSGRDALAALDQKSIVVDCILLDMVMPEMSGYEVFHELKKNHPHIPVLLTSGFSQSEQTGELMDQGAKGMLQKPYRSEALLKKLRQILNVA